MMRQVIHGYKMIEEEHTDDENGNKRLSTNVISRSESKSKEPARSFNKQPKRRKPGPESRFSKTDLME
jgi:hypothetical protein